MTASLPSLVRRPGLEKRWRSPPRSKGRVVALDVNEDGLQSVCDRIVELGGEANASVLDIRDLREVERAFADIGKLDGVVSTPSINVRKRILDYSDEELDRVLDVNLGRAASTSFRPPEGLCRSRDAGASSSFRRYARSSSSRVKLSTPQPRRASCNWCALSHASSEVRVNALAPGVVETPLTAPIRDKPEWYRAYAEKSVFGR